MSAVVIEDLGKRYRLGERMHDSFGDAVRSWATAPFRRREPADDADDFWALRHVSFDVREGEVVGIIGPNGAGKSTLLKILCRITEPTEGRIRLRGRIASLLEVGTGFHPDLTGRENIYLNAALLGMRRAEIVARFDEIVAFSGIERFLETPVKRYSSGMYVRLAFAVAAHLEPEILIVDEVLAVGDVEFQRKCLGRMRQVASEDGRTVLFVSHNMAAVRALCQSCCVIEHGAVVVRGDVERGVRRYLSPDDGTALDAATVRFNRPRNASPWITSATLLADDAPATAVPMGARLAVEVTFRAEPALRTPRLGLVIADAEGQRLINTNNRFQVAADPGTGLEAGIVRCTLGMVPLVAGRYSVSLWLGDAAHDTHAVENALHFDVVERDIWGTGRVPPSGDSRLWWPAEFDVTPVSV